MNIDEIPTPETDAHMQTYPFQQWDYFDHQTQEKMCDLERRLTVAREALMAIADKSVNLEHAERMADRALKQTARKP